MSELAAAALNNDWDKARRIQRQFHRLMQANFLESNPMPVKAVLAMMGRIQEVLRLPMLPVKPETRARLEKWPPNWGFCKSTLQSLICKSA